MATADENESYGLDAQLFIAGRRGSNDRGAMPSGKERMRRLMNVLES
jgi:hypothetical protein